MHSSLTVAGLGWNEKFTENNLKGAKLLHWSGRSECPFNQVYSAAFIPPSIPHTHQESRGYLMDYTRSYGSPTSPRLAVDMGRVRVWGGASVIVVTRERDVRMKWWDDSLSTVPWPLANLDQSRGLVYTRNEQSTELVTSSDLVFHTYNVCTQTCSIYFF